MKPVRVLVVDDSATMRGLIKAALERDPESKSSGKPRDPLEARQAIKALNPDVITLDVEMPNMNGIEFLEKIMRLRPMPVIMVSSLTTSGGDATIRALEAGAVDCVVKPSPGNEHAFDALPANVKMAADAFVRPSAARGPAPPSSSPRESADYVHDGRVVAIGASTGGVEALIAVSSRFPSIVPRPSLRSTCPQTSPGVFAQTARPDLRAERHEAVDGAALAPGQVYLAPGGQAHLEVVGSQAPRCRLRRASWSMAIARRWTCCSYRSQGMSAKKRSA